MVFDILSAQIQVQICTFLINILSQFRKHEKWNHKKTLAFYSKFTSWFQQNAPSEKVEVPTIEQHLSFTLKNDEIHETL